MSRARCDGTPASVRSLSLRTVQENYMQPDDETKLRVVLYE